MVMTLVSLGAGVQSTTLVLLAKHGLISPMPDGAIFADTGEEPGAVMRHLAWLSSGILPFPVYVVKAWEGYGGPRIKGPLGDEVIKAVSGGLGLHSRPPFFVASPPEPARTEYHVDWLDISESDDEREETSVFTDEAEAKAFFASRDGATLSTIHVPAGAKKRGIIRRQCTRDYKIEPIYSKTRELLGLRRGQRWPTDAAVEQWVGISTDEASRMKASRIPCVRTRWPLIELGMSRRDCVAWIAAHGYPEPPKSACTFCPFHDDAAWRRLRDHDPAGWARAVEVDEAARSRPVNGLRGTLFLHQSLVPLAEVDLRTAEDRGQINMFENECVGVCGV